MFVLWFHVEFFPSLCYSLYALKAMFDNLKLDMSTGGEIVIWAFFYLSKRVCVEVLKSSHAWAV